MKILNFGSCNIDYVYSLDHIVAPGETQTSYKMDIFPGGKGLNQSIALARAGAPVYHAGCLGSDGAELCSILKQSGVDVSYVKSVDAKNGHAVIQVSSKGENSIFLYPGSNEMITKDFVDLVLADFSAGDIILLQNEISNVGYIIDQAYKKGMCIVLNPSPIDENIGSFDFGKLSYIILNEVEAKAISGCDDIEESKAYLKTKYPHLKVMLTLGEKGCVYMDSGSEISQRAFKVKAVDTTAAGDTFTGYFVAEVSKGTDYAEVLKIATAASAIAVSRNGAAPSIPCRDEVLTTLESFKTNKSNSKSDLLLDDIESYIEQNIKNASLDELSKLLGYSTVYTGSLVRKLTNKSFSKLLQSKRCSVAAQKLKETDMSVEEIINSVGYENETFFRKIFKEKYGKSPHEFRKK